MTNRKAVSLFPLGRLLIASVVVLCAAGCDADVANDTKIIQRHEMGGYYVNEFLLSDGTRCVASYNIGITCDWSKP